MSAPMPLRTLATAATAGTGAAVAGLGLYLVTLAGAALLSRAGPGPRPARKGTPRLTVLVPAHDEADLLDRCLTSLQRQTYDREAYRVVVVADNCSDATAAIAAGAGVDVLERQEPQAAGKGRALRWAMDIFFARGEAGDAFVVVDADSVADPGLLESLAAAFTAGADAVQAEYLALVEDESPRAQLRAAAFLLFHRVRFSGRARLGLPCNLVGNGMLFSTRLMHAHPWNAFSGAEDLEFTVELRLAGVRPVFAPDARLVAPVATGWRGCSYPAVALGGRGRARAPDEAALDRS